MFYIIIDSSDSKLCLMEGGIGMKFMLLKIISNHSSNLGNDQNIKESVKPLIRKDL